MTTQIKERLLATVEKLPEGKLGEVLDFLEFILEKEHSGQVTKNGLEPAKDPILDYIGGVDHGSLAGGIDDELYGKTA